MHPALYIIEINMLGDCWAFVVSSSDISGDASAMSGARSPATGEVLVQLQSPDVQTAVSEIAAMPPDEPDRYVLTGLAAALAGHRAQASEILGKMDIQHVERFVAENCHLLDRRSVAMLGRHCLDAPVPSEGEQNGVTIFSFPKSGSTFFERILAFYTGKKALSMTSLNDSDGANLDTLMFERALRARQIARGHLSANARCVSRCVLYDVRPIFIHRNIFDSLLSFSDHFRTRYYHFPFSVPADATAIDTAIFRMAFHYVEMFASWWHFGRASDRVLTLAFEDNRKDWRAAAERALVHSGIEVDPDRLDRAIAEANDLVETDPFRVRYAAGGVRDRGRIDPAMAKRIRGLYRIFPGVDFSAIDRAA